MRQLAQTHTPGPGLISGLVCWIGSRSLTVAVGVGSATQRREEENENDLFRRKYPETSNLLYSGCSTIVTTLLSASATKPRAKNEAIRNAGSVADLLENALNGGVEESFINENRIELEIRALAATIIKQADQCLAASHSINTAVKEIADFENWMKTMEFDCINAAIRNIRQE